MTDEAEERITSASGGQALPASEQAFFEPRFGHQFSHVQIHTDQMANTLARDLGARAFTTGSDIFFQHGEYQPGSSEGRELLAHELTHVIQQGGGSNDTGTAQAQVVQRDNSYQSEMRQDGSALVADRRANEAAHNATSATHPVSDRLGDTGIGLLDPMDIPLDYADAGVVRFRDMAQNLNRGAFPSYYGDLKDTLAYKTMMKKVERYEHDKTLLEKADQSYNHFVFLANVATRGVLKTRAVRDELGFTASDDLGEELSARELEALRTAARGIPTAGNRVAQKGEALAGQRQSLDGAASGYAAALRGLVIDELNKKLSSAQADRQKILDTIAKVEKFASLVQKGATLVCGGAGKLAKLAGPAKEAPTGPAAVEAGAGKVAKGTSTLGKVAVFGMKLYYADELAKLQAQINVLGGHIRAVQAEVAYLRFQEAKQTFFGKVDEYRVAVEEFVQAIDERREQMAIFGAKADEIMSRRGKHQNISQTMLMAATVMESKPLLDTAYTAGQEADTAIGEARGHMQTHRGPYASEGYETGSWHHTRWDSKTGPDQELAFALDKRVENWIKGAETEGAELSGQIGTPSSPQPADASPQADGGATGIQKLLERVGISEY